MKEAKSYEELKALPYWVIVRTARGRVRERGYRNTPSLWSEMGMIEDPEWTDEDFPAQVLWSYVQEICPPVMLPPLGVGGTLPTPHWTS
jgi:hypothetical protein